MSIERTGTRDALLSYRADYTPMPLERLPSLGDRVRLLLGGNVMLVVDVHSLLREREESLNASGKAVLFSRPIGVLYVDSAGHISQTVVPLGVLCKA